MYNVYCYIKNCILYNSFVESTSSNKINEKEYVDEESKTVIEYSWKKRFDSKFKGKCKPFTIPRLKHIITFLPASIRLVS